MKIFISWSGELSGNVAKNLKNSLSGLIQQAEFFLSSIDIAKGESWDQTLIKELSTCNYGIVCLTKENVSAPWINFEAGALAKQLDSKIYVLMVDVQASDINGPLSRFQATRLEKDDFRVMVDSICKEIDDPSLKEKVEGIYEFVWQGFEEKVRQYILESSHPDATENSDIPERLVIEEILRITRQISVSVESMSNQHLHFIERAYPLFCEKSLGAQRPLKIDSVCSVDELAKSIISQHVITLKKGNYCTTDITYQNEHVFHEDVFDGKQLVIDEINNLILLGNGATLTTRPRYAQVLCFNRCNNIIIDDFIMGHTKEPGTCLGNVIEFRDCSNVYLNNLKLYGCGTYGIELIDCRNRIEALQLPWRDVGIQYDHDPVHGF